MPDQRQPDQPIDRNRDRDQIDRQGQQSRQDPQNDRPQNLQGQQTGRMGQQDRDSMRSDRMGSRDLERSSRSSETDQEPGLDMLGSESGRRSRSFGDEGLGQPYDTDDMEARSNEVEGEGNREARSWEQNDRERMDRPDL